jgi:hypothetical protein
VTDPERTVRALNLLTMFVALDQEQRDFVLGFLVAAAPDKAEEALIALQDHELG